MSENQVWFSAFAKKHKQKPPRTVACSGGQGKGRSDCKAKDDISE